MLSLTQFKKNIFPMFKLMTNTGMIFEIVYKGTVYDVHVQTTKKKPHTTRAKKARKDEVTLQSIDMNQCNLCDSIRVGGICMNKECPSNHGAH